MTAQVEFDSHFSIQSETLSVNDEINSHSKLASAAVKAQKAKFRFPKMDPADNVVTCTQTPEQKMSDILRIWSQLLTKDETKFKFFYCNKHSFTPQLSPSTLSIM